MNRPYVTPRPEFTATERRAPIALPREDSYFQGWGPRL